MTTPVSEQYALTVTTPAALAPLPASALPEPVKRTGLAVVFNRDTYTHAAISLASVGGLGVFAYAGGLTTSLVAAAALATGVVASRFLGGSNPAVAALEAERRALNTSRGVLEHQVAALAGDRTNLDADRAQLAIDRQELSQRVDQAAQSIIQPQLREIEEARASIASELAGLEKRRGSVTEALEKKPPPLTAEDVRSIHKAAAGYYHNGGRFAAAATSVSYISLQSQRVLSANQGLAVLLGTGQVVAGVAQHGSDSQWSIPAAGATTITSIAQFRSFLRLATGQEA